MTLVKFINKAIGGGILLMSLTISVQSAQALSFSSAIGTYNIPDNNATGVSVPITISGQPTITIFNSVTIYNLTHTWYGDLRAFISNGTTNVQLFATQFAPDIANFYSNGSFDLNSTYTFAPTGNNWYLQGDPVPSGTYASLGDLSTFIPASLRASINGTWTLNIQDRAGADIGAFTQWSFDVTPAPQPPSPVPEPLTMLGAGTALGFGSFFKRKLAKDKKSNKA